jgi:two-component system LytT family response regulator
LKVIIVDDEKYSRARLHRFLKDSPQVEIVAECADGRNALESIQSLSPDVVFLDIQMPDLDGFRVVSGLKNLTNIPLFIFVTAYDEYAAKAFEIEAIDYVLKPFNKKRILKAVAKAEVALRNIQEYSAKERRSLESRFAFKEDGRLIILKFDEINWAEAKGHYSCIHTRNGNHICKMGINDLAKEFPSPTFQRIHRSYIVNLDRVREMHPLFHGDFILVLENNDQVVMSRSYSAAVKRLLRLPSKTI